MTRISSHGTALVKTSGKKYDFRDYTRKPSSNMDKTMQTHHRSEPSHDMHTVNSMIQMKLQTCASLLRLAFSYTPVHLHLALQTMSQGNRQTDTQTPKLGRTHTDTNAHTHTHTHTWGWLGSGAGSDGTEPKYQTIVLRHPLGKSRFIGVQRGEAKARR